MFRGFPLHPTLDRFSGSDALLMREERPEASSFNLILLIYRLSSRYPFYGDSDESLHQTSRGGGKEGARNRNSTQVYQNISISRRSEMRRGYGSPKTRLSYFCWTSSRWILNYDVNQKHSRRKQKNDFLKNKQLHPECNYLQDKTRRRDMQL